MSDSSSTVGTPFFTRALILLFLVNLCAAQEPSPPQPEVIAPNLSRLEGVDAGSGIHYVRLILSLPPIETSNQAPPRFIMECTEIKGKRDLAWFVSFGGVAGVNFTPPFRSTQAEPFPPRNPSANLRMTFEGYMKWKPYVRFWEVLPSGELRYRNPGLESSNMDGTRFFLQYLNSLPGLRIGYARPAAGNPPDLLFQTRPMLDELKKISACPP
jgi:hypothetical protein